MSYFLFTPDFLSHTRCTMVDCYVVLRHPAEIAALHIPTEGSGRPELHCNRAAAGVYTLILTEMYRLPCRFGAQTHFKRIHSAASSKNMKDKNSCACY